jgi:hypothetical protein
LHVEVMPPPSVPEPIGTHWALPPESLHTNCAGQPDIEQSPAWHLLSAPQFEPAGQSEGLVQSCPPLGGATVPSPSAH